MNCHVQSSVSVSDNNQALRVHIGPFTNTVQHRPLEFCVNVLDEILYSVLRV